MRLRHSNASPIAKTARRAGRCVVSVSASRSASPPRRGAPSPRPTAGAAGGASAPKSPPACGNGAAPQRQLQHRTAQQQNSNSNAGRHTASATGNAIVAAAARELGKPYCYGGGGINGPGDETNISSEPGCAPPHVGFDCMSLAQYAVYQGTGHTGGAARTTAPGRRVGTFIKPQATEASGPDQPRCPVTPSSSAGRSATTTTPASTPAAGRCGTRSTTTSRCRSTRSRRCTATTGTSSTAPTGTRPSHLAPPHSRSPRRRCPAAPSTARRTSRTRRPSTPRPDTRHTCGHWPPGPNPCRPASSCGATG